MNTTNVSLWLRRAITTLSIAVLLLMPVHAAEMYKWVDSEGVVHFSDEQPAGVNNAKKMRADEPDANTDISKDEADSSGQNKPAKNARQGAPGTIRKIKNFPIMKQDHNWCALTSIAMIAQYYGYHIDPMQVSVESGVPLAQGMSIEAILKYFQTLKALKLDLSYHYKGDIEEVKRYIDDNIPVLWLHATNRWGGRGRHAAVVIGYDDTERRMYIADPGYGREIYYSYTDFLRRWHGTRELLIVVTSRI
ncbi:MAG TPA: C39 family peptidase [Syntrophales bacterium]|nr:C39 family peptidase [Syntrophales bacterium]